MTKRTAKILINLISCSFLPASAIAAPGNGLDFRPTTGDFRINYGAASNSVTVMSSGLGETMSTHIGKAMEQDPKAFCTDIEVGQTNNSLRTSNSQTQAGSSSGKGDGGADVSVLGIVNVGAGGGGSSSNSWNNRITSSNSHSNSRSITGKDCSALLNNAASIDISRMDNETNRLGILVGNETQRYDVDKRFQLGLKQIQAQQVVTVFGGGANAMTGSMMK
jgi:hypothetical protein